MSIKYFKKIKTKIMTIEQKGIYIMYFWKYATAEQIGDATMLSVDVIAEYILEIWKEYYMKNKKNKLNMNHKLLNSKVVNFNKLHI